MNKSEQILFALKIERNAPDECWPWTGATRGGYGMYAVRSGVNAGKTMSAHRIAYEIAHGPIPEDHDVLHRCDNPPCCNPRHLFSGTHLDNMADMRAKNRRVGKNAGSVHGRAILDENKAREILSKYATGTYKRSALMAEYGIARTTLEALLSRRTWKHI